MPRIEQPNIAGAMVWVTQIGALRSKGCLSGFEFVLHSGQHESFCVSVCTLSCAPRLRSARYCVFLIFYLIFRCLILDCKRVSTYNFYNNFWTENLHVSSGSTDTFCLVPGLAGGATMSISSCQNPSLYLYATENTLAMSINNGDNFTHMASFNILLDYWCVHDCSLILFLDFILQEW